MTVTNENRQKIIRLRASVEKRSVRNDGLPYDCFGMEKFGRDVLDKAKTKAPTFQKGKEVEERLARRRKSSRMQN